MPQIDMPLEKLKVYQGINPKPADFDEFWDSSLAELDSIEPTPSFKPADFSCDFAECFDLTFRSTKGALIYAKFARPKKIEGKLPALIKFHGLSGNCGKWISLMQYVAQGFCIAALDCRGQGGLSQDVGGSFGTTYTTPFVRGLDGEPEGLYYRDVFLDTALLTRIVMSLDYVDETRVGVYGGSQGGALSVACAALVPSVKLCAPTYPYLSDYKRVWEMDLDKGAYEGLRYYFRYFDPRHEREDEVFTKLGYIDIQYLAPRIKAKVRMATALMDTTCPPSTQFAAYNKMTCEKEMVLYPDYTHEGLSDDEDLLFMYFKENL